MAKQFSILVTDQDLHRLQEVLIAHGEVDILANQATVDLRDLLPLDVLEIPLVRMGQDSLFCFLAPHNLPRIVLAERDSPVKVHIDVDRSHLIEFWRSYCDGRVMRRGRLYYQNKLMRNGEFLGKDDAFCNWADGVMSKVRKALQFHKELGAYVGAHAAEEIASGKVTVTN